MQAEQPLAGIRVVEMASVGPVPFCAMMLEKLGAEVVIIDRPDRPDGRSTPKLDPLRCGRPSITLDLKAPSDKHKLLDLIRHADVLVEGMRPGIMEKLGLGPSVCLAANQRLVYSRISGWGPQGERAASAGHDINYLAASGGLWLIGEPDRPPVPPLNLVGDYGGGAMSLVSEILAALYVRERTGSGRLVATSILQGAVELMGIFYARAVHADGPARRGVDTLDGSAPHYRCYETADGKYVAIGAVEESFFLTLLATLGIAPDEFGDRRDMTNWPAQSERLAKVFKEHTRAEWTDRFATVDCCFSPVLDPNEALDELAKHAGDIYAGSQYSYEPATGPRAAGAPDRPSITLPDLLKEWSAPSA